MPLKAHQPAVFICFQLVKQHLLIQEAIQEKCWFIYGHAAINTLGTDGRGVELERMKVRLEADLERLGD